MSNSVHWATLAIAGAGCGGFAAVLYPLITRFERHAQGARQAVMSKAAKDAVTEGLTEFRAEVNRRFDANDRTSKQAADEARRTNDRVLRLETVQFGGNGGGLREQANKTDGKVDRVIEGLGELRGAFDEHVRKGER